MKKCNLVLFALCISTFYLSAQSSSWVNKEIGNGISVSFPDNPIYETSQSISYYAAKSSNCAFMVLINQNLIPQNFYNELVRTESEWTEEARKKVAYSFLDSFVNGKLNVSGSNTIISNVKMGQFYGKTVEYSDVIPSTGEVGKRFTIILAFLKYNKIISFECWYMKNSTTSNEEKTKFFNSIYEK